MKIRSTRSVAAAVLALVPCGIYVMACGGGSQEKPGASTTPPAGTGTANPDGGVFVATPGEVAPPTAGEATPIAVPGGITFPAAPAFSAPIKYEANRSSVMLYMPIVDGARDYRVFALVNGVKIDVTASGGEDVSGATIACAGLRQHNQCDDSEAITEYGRGDFWVPKCSEDARAVNVPKTVLRQVEYNKLAGATVLAIEAIDAQCPFPGIYGNAHADVAIDEVNGPTRPATVNGQVLNLRLWPKSFPVRTEAEIRAQYKSLILNGHGPAPRPASATESPYANLAQPAPPIAPKILARAIVQVTPTGTAQLPSGFKDADVFDDFSDDNDQPKLVKTQRNGEAAITPANWPAQNARLFQTSKWNFYTFDADPSQFFVAQGQLNSVLGDIAQGVFSSNLMYPKRPIQMPADDASFIHSTFEIQTDASQRRYFVFHACGAATAGQTYEGDKLAPQSAMVIAPGFMTPTDALPISTKGWNCFQIIPRGGAYDGMAGGPFKTPKGENGRPETDIRILVNRPTAAGGNPLTDRDSATLLGPAQLLGGDQKNEGAWYRTWDANKKINGVVLDDQMFISQRTKFDVFLNRGRVVIYVNGVQKICNDFPTAQRLTMAEAAIGIGHILYHSNLEAMEFVRPDWIRSGQYYIRHNTPLADTRSLDNVGIREGAALPASFQEGPCFKP